jgi:hypothetical protein
MSTNLINKGDVVYVRAVEIESSSLRYLVAEVLKIHDDHLLVQLPDDGPRMVKRLYVLTQQEVEGLRERFLR